MRSPRHIAVGEQFERWTVLERPSDYTGSDYSRTFLCKCACGTIRPVSGRRLLLHKTQASVSCGCFRVERLREALTKHGSGGWKNDLYDIWKGIKRRCSVKSDHNFANYGGRGITICERWLTFQAFVEDMGPRPSPYHSIDRYPDNGGNYEPGNCRWATSMHSLGTKQLSARPVRVRR